MRYAGVVLAAMIASAPVHAHAQQARPWPNGRAPLRFASSVSPARQARLFAACGQWEKVAPVRCVPAEARETAWVEVLPHAHVCQTIWADNHFGIPGPRVGATWMNLAPSCWESGTLVHELGHVFGLVHEHQRADRDRFIEVLYENIPPYAIGAFIRYDWLPEYSDLAPYDLQSVMHYSSWAFSNGHGPTLKARPEFAHIPMGGLVPSRGDALKLRAIYGASASAASTPTLTSPTINQRLVTLKWSSVAGTLQYVVIARVSGVIVATLASTTPTLSVVAPPGVYQVSVRAGAGAESNTMRVEVW